MAEVALRSRATNDAVTAWQDGVDWPILISALILIGAGLMMSLAAGPGAADRLGYDDPYFFTKRHIMFAAAAIIVLVAATFMDKVWARRAAALVFIGALALLAFILVSGHEAKGAQRWLRIGSF